MLKKTTVNFLLVLSFISCTTSKNIKNPPFTIVKATYINWYGGQEGVSGIRTEIEIADLKEKIDFKYLYFKNKKETLITLTKKGIVLTSNINTSTRQTSLQMHRDPKKEYGNSLPISKTKFPFELKENEAVISYILNKKEYFYKLELKKGKNLFYP